MTVAFYPAHTTVHASVITRVWLCTQDPELTATFMQLAQQNLAEKHETYGALLGKEVGRPQGWEGRGGVVSGTRNDRVVNRFAHAERWHAVHHHTHVTSPDQ